MAPLWSYFSAAVVACRADDQPVTLIFSRQTFVVGVASDRKHTDTRPEMGVEHQALDKRAVSTESGATGEESGGGRETGRETTDYHFSLSPSPSVFLVF